MGRDRIRARGWVLAAAVSVVGTFAGCGSKPSPPAPPASAPAATAVAVPAARPLAVNSQTWSPEAMEALLAPIALYPDPVLSQVLIASTNPQEVLDAGNWLIDHPALADKALDEGAVKAGFTPPMRALMQFRQIVDQMCLKMGWTAELGQAFTNDQPGVLAAVQRLRRQAQEAGSLVDSPQMKVETQDQGGEEAIVIAPPNPQVVYVPQYDPMTAYASAPAVETDGYGTDEMVTTGVLAFGAGLIVGNVFDNDADDYYHHHYYYPNYGYGRYPPCPPRNYRRAHGPGYRPGHYYNRPPHYEDTLRDNDFLVVDKRRDRYWHHFDERPTDRPRADSVPSPITAARMNRPQPSEFIAETGAPTHRVETMTGTPESLSGYRGRPPDVDLEGPRPVERDRGEQHREGAQGARLQGGAKEPPTYSAAPERHARGGDRDPPTYDDAPWRQHHADVGPEVRGSAQPRLVSPARMSAPPSPAYSGEGTHANAGAGSHNGGDVKYSAGTRAQDHAPRAARGKSGVEVQQQ